MGAPCPAEPRSAADDALMRWCDDAIIRWRDDAMMMPGRTLSKAAPPAGPAGRKESTFPEGRLGASHTGLSHRMSQQKLCTYPSSRGTYSLAPSQPGNPEKETESKHSGFWGTSLRMREKPSAPLA
ncbi:hypothetical protein HGM15179_014515 [Zosterops borbonicus]|uniref:Uncharacterized protein n=1 Tax=Zosterops borbonicus TaxID=364589 RepID=A0A8K1G6P9_9PASS|nr:hypothetical protein HGM15179_014515 [Zosterops borbonicus]